MINKEYGSDFAYHHLSGNLNQEKTDLQFFNLEDTNFHFSGRSALYYIILNGIKRHNWKTILVPTYYCHEVTRFIQDLPVKIEYYHITPFIEKKLFLIKEHDQCETAVVIVDFFGLDKINYEISNAFIIEDITHNLKKSKKNQADYVFGSLRKILPVPVGGFSFSNVEKFDVVLNDINDEAIKITEIRIKAMRLKTDYLNANNIDKDHYRSLYALTEEKLSQKFTNTKLPKIVKNQILQLNLEKIFTSKVRNIELIKSLIEHKEFFEIITNEKNSEFALTLKFINIEDRDKMKSYLIQNKVYPIVLWPEQFTSANVFLQKSILFIHMDFRYDEEDIYHIAQLINNFPINV